MLRARKYVRCVDGKSKKKREVITLVLNSFGNSK